MSKSSYNKVIECWIGAEANRLKLLRSIIKNTAIYIGIDKELTKNLILAVNEACMNIIQHAYHNIPNGEIHITIKENDEAIIFVLQDDAPCVELSSIKSRKLDNLRPGGLGVHFINKIMDGIEYDKCGAHLRG